MKEQSDGKAEVDGFVADISTLQGMHQFCDEILARTDRLDCLINNAGKCKRRIFHDPRKTSAELSNATHHRRNACTGDPVS